MLFTKSDCLKTNLWIKNHCLKNGKELAPGDLLIANNNVFIPDETGFGNPKRILNGMYFTVKEIKEHICEEISVKGLRCPVCLSYTKVAVSCLSLCGQTAELWFLDNYLTSIDELANEEQRAVRIFLKNRIDAQKKESPFINSDFYKQLLDDNDYRALTDEEKSAIGDLIRNRDLKTKEEKTDVSRI